MIIGLLAVTLMIGNSAITGEAASTDTVSSATTKTTTVNTTTAQPTEKPKAAIPKPATPKATQTPKTSPTLKATPAPKATPVPKVQPTANKAVTESQKNYESGIYRGTYSDNNEMQVGLEFELKENRITSIKFRHLMYKGKDYKNEKEDQTIIALTKQYNTLLTHLVDKDLRTELKSLYKPGDIVKDSGVDGVSGATLRAGKLISAINDALNRGVYSYPSSK